MYVCELCVCIFVTSLVSMLELDEILRVSSFLSGKGFSKQTLEFVFFFKSEKIYFVPIFNINEKVQ